MPLRSEDEYNIGWICALREEMVAARAMLDEEDGFIGGRDHDHNAYFAGRIHEHNVVIAVLPAGIDGLVAATAVAKDMVRTFTQLRFLLLVGIGGGIPDLAKDIDIRLGDIVVSQPSRTSGGVVHYDKGKSKHGGSLEIKGTMNNPPNLLLTAVHALQAENDFNDSQGRLVSTYIAQMVERRPHLKAQGYTHPGESTDKLFSPTYVHREGDDDCDQCSAVEVISRQARGNETPRIHYGIIASGNQVVKDPILRDELRDKHGAICIEMEAAALMNNFPSIVIRGICDYADSHKNDDWHRYAAVTAAAYAKELLLYVSTSSVRHQRPVQEVLDFVQNNIQPLTEQLRISETQKRDGDSRKCHQSFKLSPYETQKNINPERAPDTCRWVLEHPVFRRWYENGGNDLLWISATPGCGKSVLTRSLVDRELRSTNSHTCCYFFFKDNELQDKLVLALCSVLHQLFAARPRLLEHALPAWQMNGANTTWEVDEMWRVLLKASEDTDAGEISCVFDGLDECRKSDRHGLIEKLCSFYADPRSPAQRQCKLKFLVTSRPYDDIRSEFHDNLLSLLSYVPQIRLEGELQMTKIGYEIDSVIRLRVAEIAAKARLSQELRRELENKLLDMRNRTYLWLSLTIGEIYETILNSIRLDKKAVDLAIKSLPESVEQAYERILNRIHPTRQTLVKTTLQIIIGARRALNVSEMAVALGLATANPGTSPEEICIEEDHLKRNIQEWCGLFVFIDHSKVYLVHQTAKEFLLWSPGCERGIWKYSLNLTDSGEILAQACLKCLCLALDSSPTCVMGAKPETLGNIAKFLDYASEYWVGHFRDADSQQCSSLGDILRVYENPQLGSRHDRSWFELSCRQLLAYHYLDFGIGHDSYGPKKLQLLARNHVLTSIHFAALLGHHAVLEQLLSQGTIDLHAADAKGHSTLAFAMVQQDTRALSILLRYGADVNAIGIHGTPLQTAIRVGRKDIVQLFLDHGADINLQVKQGVSALCTAASRRDRDIVQLLLKRGAEVDAGGNHKIVLRGAVVRGSGDIVQLLLDYGTNVKAWNSNFKTVLSVANLLGDMDVFLQFLDCETDGNAHTSHDDEGLGCAATTGNGQSVRALFNSEFKLESYRDASQAMQEAGCDNVICFLLAAGVNLCQRSKSLPSMDMEYDYRLASARECVVILAVLMKHTGTWKNVDQTLELRSKILVHYSDPEFGLTLSSDMNQIKEVIDNMQLRHSEWFSPSLFRFKSFFGQWKYVKFSPALRPKRPDS